MTLGELRAAVRSLLLETSAGFWTDAELNDYLNDGYMELVPYARIPKIPPMTITTAADQQDYTLPSDLVAVYSLTLDGQALIPLSMPHVMCPGERGRPRAFLQLSEKMVRLLPVPDGVYTLELGYFYRPPRMSADTDVPAIPEQWHNILKFYAVAQAKRKDDDPAFASYWADWQQAKEQFILDRHSVQQQNFTVVADPWGVWW